MRLVEDKLLRGIRTGTFIRQCRVFIFFESNNSVENCSRYHTSCYRCFVGPRRLTPLFGWFACIGSWWWWLVAGCIWSHIGQNVSRFQLPAQACSQTLFSLCFLSSVKKRYSCPFFVKNRFAWRTNQLVAWKSKKEKKLRQCPDLAIRPLPRVVAPRVGVAVLVGVVVLLAEKYGQKP